MDRAILLVDHGSQMTAANAMLEDVAELVRARTADAVYVAHMELAEPTIAQAFDRAVEDGAERVFVFPYFLAPGRHSRHDIPRMCAEAAHKHPGLQWHCAGPIGVDPLLADLIVGRVSQCEADDFECDDCPERTRRDESRPEPGS